MKKVVSNIVIVLFFTWIICFVYQHEEDFYKITNISFFYLVPTLLLAFCSYVGNGNFLRLMLKKYSIAISLRESTSIALLTTFFNTIMPMQSGAALRAVYLKRKHNFNYTNFFVTLYALYVIVFFNVACIGIAVSTLIYIKYSIISYFVFGILILTFLALGIIFIVPLDIPNQKRRLFQLCKKTVDSWNQIKRDKRFVIKLQSLQLINFTIRTLIMYLVFLSMGLSLPIEKVIYFQIVTSIMSIINITPGAIGIQEALFLLVGKLFFISTSDILIMALLLRSVLLAVNFTCAPFASYILFKKSLFDVKTELVKNSN